MMRVWLCMGLFLFLVASVQAGRRVPVVVCPSLENSTRFQELSDRVARIEKQTGDLVQLLDHRLSTSSELEGKIAELRSEVAEVKVQLQILVKAFIALLAVLLLLILLIFLRLRKPPRGGSIRL